MQGVFLHVRCYKPLPSCALLFRDEYFGCRFLNSLESSVSSYEVINIHLDMNSPAWKWSGFIRLGFIYPFSLDNILWEMILFLFCKPDIHPLCIRVSTKSVFHHEKNYKDLC